MTAAALLADLSGLAPIILIAVAVIGVLAVTARPKTVFEIKIADGAPSIVAGDPPEAFVKDVERICQLWGVESGSVRAVQAGGKIHLIVRGDAERQSQAFLNAWRNPI